MIYIEKTNLYALVKGAYVAIDGASQSKDPDIYKEDTAVLTLLPGYEDPKVISNDNGTLKCIFDKQAYFPNHNSLKIAAEDEYWNEKLINCGFLAKVSAHLKQNPNSRSCLYGFWDNDDFLTANPKGNCITQIYCRLRDNELEMHAHIRANDVHRCLFMDLAYLMFAHKYLVEQTGYKKGRFVHFVDSLHIYNKSVDEFQDQLLYLSEPKGAWVKI